MADKKLVNKRLKRLTVGSRTSFGIEVVGDNLNAFRTMVYGEAAKLGMKVSTRKILAPKPAVVVTRTE
jgi:hypothetical protein